MGTRLDPTANERTAYIDSLCQILTYARGPEEVGPIHSKDIPASDRTKSQFPVFPVHGDLTRDI